MTILSELTSWLALKHHAETLQVAAIKDLKNFTSRNKQLIAASKNITLDFSNQRLNAATVKLLVQLAHERHLAAKINSLTAGEIVNLSEEKPALHTALRSFDSAPILVNGKNIIPDILAAREQIKSISTKIRAKKWLGFSGEPITDIVNIGIGGSDLGPRLCIAALADYQLPDLNYHFISDADPRAFNTITAKLKPETTLFIISSKSFTTKETLYNAQKALNWLNQPNHINQHFIAVTANADKAYELGLQTILPIWDWVGGRYSLCSAINLITAIAIGYEQFLQLLAGANSMDSHFLATPFNKNLPVLLALLGVWNNNFLHIHNLLMLTYCQRLEYFVPYIQQLDMESNGKSIDNQQRAVNYATSPMIWGGLGNQAQHSYFQLLCQGTHRLTVDFIMLQEYSSHLINEMGETKIKVLAEGVTAPLQKDGYIPGNIPCNIIKLTECTPFAIGELIALYEHKIYTQSVIWDINPFDQPGVDSAKNKAVQSFA